MYEVVQIILSVCKATIHAVAERFSVVSHVQLQVVPVSCRWGSGESQR